MHYALVLCLGTHKQALVDTNTSCAYILYNLLSEFNTRTVRKHIIEEISTGVSSTIIRSWLSSSKFV